MITKFNKFKDRDNVVLEEMGENPELKWATSLAAKYSGDDLCSKAKKAAEAEKKSVKAYLRMKAFVAIGLPEIACLFADKASEYEATLAKGGGTQSPSYVDKSMQPVEVAADEANEAKKSVEVSTPDAFELEDRLKGRKGIFSVGCVTTKKANVYYNDKIHNANDIKALVAKENETIKENAGDKKTEYRELAENILETYVPPFNFKGQNLDHDYDRRGKVVFMVYENVDPAVIAELSDSAKYKEYEEDFNKHIDKYLDSVSRQDMKTIFNSESIQVLGGEDSLTYEIMYWDNFVR